MQDENGNGNNGSNGNGESTPNTPPEREGKTYPLHFTFEAEVTAYKGGQKAVAAAKAEIKAGLLEKLQAMAAAGAPPTRNAAYDFTFKAGTVTAYEGEAEAEAAQPAKEYQGR